MAHQTGCFGIKSHMTGYRRCGSLIVLLAAAHLLYWTYFSLAHEPQPLSPAAAHATPAPPPPLNITDEEEQGEYLVDTPTCHIPNVDPFDDSVRPFIKPPKPIVCDGNVPPLTYSDLDHVYFVPERQHFYGAKPPALNVTCCTRDILRKATRSGANSSPLTDRQSVIVGAECRPLNDSYRPEAAGGVEVTCFLGGKEVFKDYHHFIPLRSPLESRRAHRRPQDVKPSILIFMFDSLSRLQFARWFPKTRRLLNEKLHAFELSGINKEGDNTFPNLAAAMLTGMGRTQMEKLCAPNTKTDFLDPCPFIWKEFEQAGYRTCLAEDLTKLGTFTYRKMGFNRQPTDYYTMPTALLSDANTLKLKKTLKCEGKRRMFEWTFKFAQDMATRFWDRPFWGLVVQNSFTHDYFTYAYMLDEPYSRMVETLMNIGALNNTVLITMGDHGLRFGEERNTYIGALEERLPLMNIYFPTWMQKRYPVAFNNLKFNQRRLTSFRDVHATMRSLMNADRELTSVDQEEAPANASAVSLFRRISRLRTCGDIQIPPHYCTCWISKEVPLNDTNVKAAAKAIMEKITAHLKANPRCAKLELAKVVSARIAENPSASQVHRQKEETLTVQIQTEPKARFAATVRAKGDQLLISGPISRLDKYGHLSWCSKDSHQEMYCICSRTPHQKTKVTGQPASEPTTNQTKPNTASEPTTNQTKPNTARKPTTNQTKPNTASEPTTNRINPNTASEPTRNQTKPNTASEPTKNRTKSNTASEPTKNKTKPNTASEPTTNQTKPNTASEPTTNRTKPNTPDR